MRTFAPLALAVGLAAAAPAPWSPSSFPAATAPPFLNDLAHTKGKLWFGTAADIPGPEQSDVEYMTILNDTNIFGEITPANYMKWLFTEPEQGVFNYTGGDVILDLAEQHGKRVRCHNLVWISELPDWVTNGNWTSETLSAVLVNHITTIVEHWGNRCYSWDVVNEALNSNGTFMPSIFYEVIGEEYFFTAYKAASDAVRSKGLDVKLYYNDYGIESPSEKTTAAVQLLSELQARDIQIDGVGFESHFEVGGTPSKADQMAAMAEFTAIGLDVAQTEIDVRFTSLPYNSTGLAVQSQNYYDTVAACIATPKCIGMTVWDFVDQYSWVPGTFTGQGGADLYGLYNETYGRKPAYYAVGEALVGAPCSGCLAAFPTS